MALKLETYENCKFIYYIYMEIFHKILQLL